MELFSAEANAIQAQVKDWLNHPDYELETTFGAEGRVDATTFLAVAKRLRAKGFTSLPQEDRLTITTKEHVRFSLSSLGIIQQYCRDDVLAGKPFVAMIKDRSTATANVDLEEYGVRIKARRELPMAPDDADVKKLLDEWPRISKAFRMIRRWSFEGDGVRIDMSIVRSTKKTLRGEYKWQRKFRDQDVMQTPPIYEIEVELLRKDGDTVPDAMKRLIKGVGEVLRGIQRSTLLIRSSTKKKVLDGYKALTGSDRFRGPAPRTLQKKNFGKEREEGEANLRDGFNVTDKADGLRCLGYCDSKGELFLIDMSMKNIYRTGLRQPECRLSLVDGEWVTLTKDKEPIQQFLAFDIFYAADKKEVSQLPFQSPSPERDQEGRWGQLRNWTATWNKGEGAEIVAAGVTAKTRLNVAMKDFLFGRAGDESIFRVAARVLDTARIYYTDGLIFTSNTAPLPAESAATFYEQFKWKPPRDNTVDFLVKFEKSPDSEFKDKITTGVHPDSGQTVSYKTLRLFVGSSTDNPRQIVLNKLELPKKERMFRGKGEYKPVLFTPTDFPDQMASICNLDIVTDEDTGEIYVKTEDTEEPIQDMTIVEMSYNPKAAPGWRWTPLRVRMDKTERLQAGQLGRTLNSDKVANDVWNSIYDPITTAMIRTGSDTPSEEELAELSRLSTGMEMAGKRYFDRKAQAQDQQLTRGMRDFHNKWIKEGILYRTGLAGGGKTLLDTACGVGADLQIWRRARVAFVLGVDYSGDNISSTKDSIYKRYMESMVTAGGRERIAPMIFANGNSAKNYVSGDAGANPEEADILRAVLGRAKPKGALAPFTDDNASRLKQGVDCVSCMFAIHYFFENADTFRGFMKNVSENLKVGGYFIGCCFDGDKVFDLLRGVPMGSSKSGTEKGSTLWTITKQYEADDMPEGEESIGLPIDVEFVTIGTTHREYLVSFRFLKDAMEAIGCELLAADELKKMGLKESSNTFDVSYEMAEKAGKKFPMIDTVKQFSFLNRWFVFRRKRTMGVEGTVASGVASLREAAVESVRRGLSVPAGPAADGKEEEVEEAALKSAVEEGAESAAKNRAASAAAAARPIGRTVPVAPDAAAAAPQSYALGELFQFFDGAAEKDVLGIGDKGAGQWLAPTAPFPIEDPYDSDVLYPSMDHYLAAMRFRVASTTPELAASIFGREGTIHQKYLRARLLESEGGTKPISEKRDKQLLHEEAVDVREAIRPSSFKKYKSKFDDALWATKKDEVLREGLRQRWETDARFRKIVEAARDKGKTLLYYAPGANSANLGGVRKQDGRIEGENRIGKILMELAGF